MFDVDSVLQLHESTVILWHAQPIENPYNSLMQLICKQHGYNFELWHQEDIARSPDASDTEIATVKRNIDRLNQSRNDHIEKIDDWLSEELTRQAIQPRTGARLNTETVGSVVDRLSILALRLYHYREQLERKEIDQSHRDRVAQRVALCVDQRQDLSQSLRELLEAIERGDCRHKTYRQMKMYNDPSLNPYLYRSGSRVDFRFS